jgi:NAD(P)-dependent dehydrogenase (short-subunit alcohol dehydrogenase family)
MNELFSIKDQVVVITGGTGVLGACIGEYLALQGAKVVLLGRRKEEGDRIVADIRAKGGEAIFLVSDVMNQEIVEQNCADVLEKYGKVDALLNAAGGNMPGATIQPTGTFFDIKIEEFQRVLNVNLTGTVIPSQVFLKPMVEAGKGAIVNFSSMAAFRPMTRVLGYAAAKAGISNFTAFLANEVATKFTPAIRVNAIAPGFFLTNQNRALLTNPDGSLTQRGEDVIRQTPFKRFGRPEELCGTIQYLISDAASFVTGTVAVVDGGFNAFAM